ncbi:hypothetical protein BDY21DRAFT_423944 [Lineolata rhizophorae]|uniref:Uncharacterized protein n=1 Tax=Lineolata rhizophorae TaxID=578093 RepID=A0A6A6NRK2_9PEZI|nr:hypothetical protein BDY21DRAFT_423944 [Lineolata rhizophorae]
MAPVPDFLTTLFRRSASDSASLPDLSVSSLELDAQAWSPRAVQALHRRTDDDSLSHGSGAQDPYAFNNKGFLALFALIGCGMVIASLWFFLWAKNGGFKWRKGDWDDYKSTVLRRKGPDGKTLSNATPSTNLGGGSVVHGQSYYGKAAPGKAKKGKKGKKAPKSEATTDTFATELPYSDRYTDEDPSVAPPSSGYPEMQEVTAGMGMRGGDARRSRDRNQHHHHHQREGGHRRSSRRGGDDDLTSYRHEKPARVGGINRAHDGSHFDYSGTGTESSSGGGPTSTCLDPVQVPPAAAIAPTKKDEKRARKEAARQEKQRSKQRRADEKAAEQQAKRQRKERAKAEKSSAGPKNKRAAAAAAHDDEGSAADGSAAALLQGNGVDSPRRAAPAGPPSDPAYSAYDDSMASAAHAAAAAYGAAYGSRAHNAPSPRRGERGSSSRGHSRSRARGGGGGGGVRTVGATEPTEASSDVGTKVYRHVIPGLTGAGTASAPSEVGGPAESVFVPGLPRGEVGVEDSKRRKRGAGFGEHGLDMER